MTYEGYKGSSDPHGQQNPPYEHQQPAYSYHPDSGRSRSRASSTARSDVSGQKPLYDTSAVNNAFDRFDRSEAAGQQQVDPNLIAQITEQVRKQVMDSLISGEIPGAVPSAQSSQAPPVRSPTTSSVGAGFPPPPARNVYTPPSPNRHEYSSTGSMSPEMPHRGSVYEDADETPTPRVEKRDSISMPPDAIPVREKSRSRPPPATRMSTDGEATTVEKIWNRLFDTDGHPTARLGQFLRGLAIHLIEDYEPKNSIIVTPTKLIKFYQDVALPDELFPWIKIFTLSNSSICKMYRDLRCEHYLIQESPEKVPCIPALTPKGFQTWMTLHIQAHPDIEYRRLSKAVLDMPISNADDRKERFPKELSRRLFPKEDNLQAQQQCAAALSAEGRIPVPKCTAFPPPPPAANFQQPFHTGSLERERSPYHGGSHAGSHVDSSAVTDSEDEAPLSTSVQIERERKPYTAKEGTGRIYKEDPPIGAPLQQTRSETFPDASSRHHRSHSSATPASVSAAHSRDYPPSAAHNHRYSRRDSRRQRSPSFSSSGTYGTRSDGSVSDIPSGYYASNLHSGGPLPVSTSVPPGHGSYDPLLPDDPDSRKYARDAELKRADWARRQAEEEEAAAAGGMRRSVAQGAGVMPGGATSYPPPPPPQGRDRDREEEYYRSRGGSVNGYGYERDHGRDRGEYAQGGSRRYG